MTVSEAQKKAVQKYQQTHKDKMKEYSKRYYEKRKHLIDELQNEISELKHELEKAKSRTTTHIISQLRKKNEKQRERIDKYEDFLLKNNIEYYSDSDYSELTGSDDENDF